MLYHEFLREPQNMLYHEFPQKPKNMLHHERLQEAQNMLYREFHDHEGTKYVISLVSAMVTKCVIQ